MGLFHAVIRCSMRAVLGTHAALDARAHSAMPAVGGVGGGIASHPVSARVCVRFGRHCCPAALVFPQKNKNQSFAVRNE